MEMLVKSKGLWKYTKTTILDQTSNQDKFSIDRKKDEVCGVIMTYNSRDILFNTKEIDYPHAI